MKETIRKADILIEALPYIQAFRGKAFVVKYGGSAVDNSSALRSILEDLIFLSVVGIKPILVHGGGPAITAKLAASGHRSSFIDGVRVTDESVIELVNEALSEVNAHLVKQIQMLGGDAKGLMSPQRVVQAKPHANSAQLGFVGAVDSIDTAPIHAVLDTQAIPVISPIGVMGDQLYNINADSVASQVAAYLEAEKLVLLTDVMGIMRDPEDEESLFSTLSVSEVVSLIKQGIIQKGMIPKVRSCMDALEKNVHKTHILNASMPHAMLLEVFTYKGVGTQILHDHDS